ncbi:13274_t:CDS:2 [Dentiscutata erythropus]|uniref:13274_t:CDS:1 n=1 Tax=Dentiscutata erythropus TaxID=1348616 RepID=A0A9N9BJ09_9GLOM|nr:13274_t:CDS:2 [Dentiscutata erythropus]
MDYQQDKRPSKKDECPSKTISEAIECLKLVNDYMERRELVDKHKGSNKIPKGFILYKLVNKLIVKIVTLPNN